MFSPSRALRPHLKLEFSFENSDTQPIMKDIYSFFSQFNSDSPDCTIQTILPIETAANKYSALLWRVSCKDRTKGLGATENDPTIIRHLHDLAALSSITEEALLLKELIQKSFLRDQGRGGLEKEKSLSKVSKEVIDLMQNDSEYEKEYQQFVDSMSYAPDDQRIPFKKALNHFIKLTNIIT